MSKISKNINVAIEQAQQSTMNFQHGAILTKGSKIISMGFNTSRSQFLNINELCIHAEMEVIRKASNSKNIPINLKMKNMPKPFLNNCSMWVVRISKADPYKLMYSKPCMKCIEQMKKLGIKKVYYSTGNEDEIKVENVKDLNSNHMSFAQNTLKMF